MLALLTERAFFINHAYPCDISPWIDFADSEITWKWDSVKYVQDAGASISSESMIDQMRSQRLQHLITDYKSKITADIHFIQTNLPLQVYLIFNNHNEALVRKLGLDKINHIDLTGCLFNHLLSPTAAFSQKIDQLLRFHIKSDQKYVGLQIRLGGDDPGKWTDGSIVDRSRASYFWTCAETVEHLIGETNDTIKYFVSSDSNTIRDEIKDLYPSKFFDNEGTSVHVDKFNRDEATLGMERTLADLYMLSLADRFVISRSNFGELAASRFFNRVFVFPNPCVPGQETSDLSRWIQLEIDNRL